MEQTKTPSDENKMTPDEYIQLYIRTDRELREVGDYFQMINCILKDIDSTYTDNKINEDTQDIQNIEFNSGLVELLLTGPIIAYENQNTSDNIPYSNPNKMAKIVHDLIKYSESESDIINAKINSAIDMIIETKRLNKEIELKYGHIKRLVNEYNKSIL